MKLIERSGKSKSSSISRNLMTAFKIIIASPFISSVTHSLFLLVVFPQTLRERGAPSEQTKPQTAKSTTETKLKEEEDDDDSPAKLCSSVDLDKVRACVHVCIAMALAAEEWLAIRLFTLPDLKRIPVPLESLMENAAACFTGKKNIFCFCLSSYLEFRLKFEPSVVTVSIESRLFAVKSAHTGNRFFF